MQYSISVNGVVHTVEAEPDTPLLWVLRDILGMTGTKFGCGVAQCGACTVHANGTAVRSCVFPISRVADTAITTIEGVGATAVGRSLQQAWLAHDVPQCGYCQGGQILAAAALLSRVPLPSDTEIDDAMSGNICRCCTYLRIRAAIKAAAASLAA